MLEKVLIFGGLMMLWLFGGLLSVGPRFSHTIANDPSLLSPLALNAVLVAWVVLPVTLGLAVFRPASWSRLAAGLSTTAWLALFIHVMAAWNRVAG